jgi:hypothetical protein
LQIGDLGQRGQSVTQVFSTLPCFVPRTPINTDSSGSRVSTRSTDGVGRRSSSSQRDLAPPSLYATGPRADTRQWPARRASPARPGRGRR